MCESESGIRQCGRTETLAVYRDDGSERVQDTYRHIDQFTVSFPCLQYKKIVSLTLLYQIMY